jgi:hypothetical protein
MLKPPLRRRLLALLLEAEAAMTAREKRCSTVLNSPLALCRPRRVCALPLVFPTVLSCLYAACFGWPCGGIFAKRAILKYEELLLSYNRTG